MRMYSILLSQLLVVAHQPQCFLSCRSVTPVSASVIMWSSLYGSSVSLCPNFPLLRQVSYDIMYMWNLKYDPSKVIYKTETDSQTQKTNLWLPNGKGWGGITQEFGISRYKLLYIKQINNKVLLYSTGNYIQYLVITHNGKGYEKEYIYV